MRRLLVLLLMLALPIRTVLAVSGLGCAVPMQMPIEMPQHADGMPCAMHAAGSSAETPADTASTACSSCAAACCATLAPMPPAITGGVLVTGGYAVAAIETSFANALLHLLERPPRLA
jgi:hypothetical protein